MWSEVFIARESCNTDQRDSSWLVGSHVGFKSNNKLPIFAVLTMENRNIHKR